MSAPPIRLQASANVDVLVIESDDALRDGMVQALTDNGLSVRGHDSEENATRSILRNETRLVIVSMDLPDVQGDRLVSLLRGVDRLSELRVVMATSKHCPTTRRVAIAAGADAFYQTDDDLATLVDIVRALLGLRAVSGARRRPELPPKR